MCSVKVDLKRPFDLVLEEICQQFFLLLLGNAYSNELNSAEDKVSAIS